VQFKLIFLTDAVIRMATLRLKVGSNSWADQFKDCFYANGKPDWSEAESLDTRSDPTMIDYVMHFATFPWKVIMTLVDILWQLSDKFIFLKNYILFV